MERIDNITLDYQNGILLIDGKKVAAPIKIIVKEPDGWDISKLFNPELARQGGACPELVVDARGLLTYLQRQELKGLVRDVLKEIVPTELTGTAGTNC